MDDYFELIEELLNDDELDDFYVIEDDLIAKIDFDTFRLMRPLPYRRGAPQIH